MRTALAVLPFTAMYYLDPTTRYVQWRHAPSHLFTPSQSYIITAGTYGKARLFDTPQKRDYLLRIIFEQAERWSWVLEAWAVMSNHYHVVACSPEDAETLARFVRAVHSKSAVWLNHHDGTPGRKVWFQYWDTCLTHRKSYLARLHYVHNNPVRHGLASNAEDYPWCSMAWLLNGSEPEFRREVLSTPCDRIHVQDDF